MNDKINGATSHPCPVHEFRSIYRYHPLSGVPFSFILKVFGVSKVLQQGTAWYFLLHLLFSWFLQKNYCWSSLVLKLLQFFMLITWLFSVNRSTRAAVSWVFFKKEPHWSNPRLEVIKVAFFLCLLCIKVKNKPTCTGSISINPSSSIRRQS